MKKKIKIFNLTYLVLMSNIQDRNNITIVTCIALQISYCDLLINILNGFVFTFLFTFLFTFKHLFRKRNFKGQKVLRRKKFSKFRRLHFSYISIRISVVNSSKMLFVMVGCYPYICEVIGYSRYLKTMLIVHMHDKL